MDLIDRECLLDNIIEWRAMLTDESEKKLLTNALRILASEFVMVLGIEPAAAEKLIDDAI